MKIQALQDGSEMTGFLPSRIVALLLVVVISLLCYWYYNEVIAWFPSHIHAWTQSDRLALAYGYLDHGFDFFTPRTYNLITTDGITGVDFPIHEYVVALTMKLFDTRAPGVFRLYTLLYSLLGYVFLYLLALRVTGRDIYAAIVVLFAFTCPILTYYQVGYIPSSTSLANTFIGFYFYFRFKQDRQHSNFYWAIGFLTLAVLPRNSVNIVLFAVVLAEAFEWLQVRKLDKKEVLTFIVAYSIIAISLWYKNHISADYGTRFLATLMPADDVTHFVYILKESWSRWHFQLLTKYHWAMLVISLFGGVIGLAKGRLNALEKQMLSIGLLLLGGSAIFFIALARQLIAHEYYFMDSLYPAIILLFIPGFRIIGKSWSGQKVIWPLLFLGLLVGGAIDSKAIQNEKYAETEWDRGEVTRKNFVGADMFLDSLGVPRDAKILVFEAYSTNAPLLLMGRRGYTILNSKEENIRDALKLDYDYIVVQDVFFPSDLIYHYSTLAYMLRRIGGNGRISVFTHYMGWVPGLAARNQARIHNLLSLTDKRYEFRKVMSQYKSGNISKDLIYASPAIDTLHVDQDAQIVYGVADKITPEIQFGGSMEFPLRNLNNADRVLIDLSFDGGLTDKQITMVYRNEFDVVLSIESPAGLKLYYKSFRVKRNNSSEVYHGYTCVFDVPTFRDQDLTVKCYIWNRFHEDLDIDAMRLTAYKTASSMH